MSEPSLIRWAAALPVLLASSQALALQPLAEFEAGAATANVDVLAAAATAAERGAELDQAWAKLGPSLTARATYTRNEYAAKVMLPDKTATITPLDQWDATLTLDLPLIDLGTWSRISAARASRAAADARIRATTDDIAKLVAQTYTRVVASEALTKAAATQRDVARANLAVVQSKRQTGTASDLDVERAVAEVARTEQDLADAAYTRATARNALHSLTGVEPNDGAPALDDDLHAEPPLAELLPRAAQVPAVTAATADVTAAHETERAAYDALLPTVGATGSERFTNATGFGTSPYWAAGVYMQWRLDLSTYDAAKAARETTHVAKHHEAKALRDARDAVHDAWQLVTSSIAKSTAARAQLTASKDAAKLAHDRYTVGTGTQLDVIQADRDAFSAEVTRIQADADLTFARVQLRIATGGAR